MINKLYRPIGVGEYRLIKQSGYAAFPPRLEWQPIFYPVLNQGYAEQIARDWNTNDAFSGFCGLVTEFEVDKSFLSRYKIENVGANEHNELWVPAEELGEFNKHIIGEIKVVTAFFGDNFEPADNPELQEYYGLYK